MRFARGSGGGALRPPVLSSLVDRGHRSPTTRCRVLPTPVRVPVDEDLPHPVEPGAGGSPRRRAVAAPRLGAQLPGAPSEPLRLVGPQDHRDDATGTTEHQDAGHHPGEPPHLRPTQDRQRRRRIRVLRRRRIGRCMTPGAECRPTPPCLGLRSALSLPSGHRQAAARTEGTGHERFAPRATVG